MFNATSTLSVMATTYASVGNVLTYAVLAILGIGVALLGVGYGYRVIVRYVTGNRFGYYRGSLKRGNRYADQELGRELYNLQEHGMTDFRY